jgi:hypothetical protein
MALICVLRDYFKIKYAQLTTLYIVQPPQDLGGFMAIARMVCKGKRKFTIPTEHQEQRALVKWLSLHPVLKDCYMKNNNEGKRTEAQTWGLKQLGLRPGVSDLFIAHPTRTYHGLWLEVKRNMSYPPSSRKTQTWVQQQEWVERMRSAGYEAKFCYGWEEGRQIVEDYLKT